MAAPARGRVAARLAGGRTPVRAERPPGDLRGHEPAQGHRPFLARRRQRAGDCQAFQRLLHGHYRGRPGALLLDEGASHTARGSQDLAAALGMTLPWLPKRSPKLNPPDTPWGQAKDVASANKQYATIDGQGERFLESLNALSDHAALHTAGVPSNDSWLKSALSKDFC